MYFDPWFLLDWYINKSLNPVIRINETKEDMANRLPNIFNHQDDTIFSIIVFNICGIDKVTSQAD